MKMGTLIVSGILAAFVGELINNRLIRPLLARRA